MWEPTATSSSFAKDDKQQQKQHQEDNSQIDSGFLSSEQILSSYSDDYPEEDHRLHHQLDTKATTPASQLDLPYSGVDKLKIATDSICLDSGLVEDDVGEEEDSDMLLERAVDNGLADWVCHSDSKHTGASQPINNLSRKVDNATASLHQLNINDSSAAAAQVPNKRTKAGQQSEAQQQIEIPEEEQPWEMCYKQDADGDTYLHMAVSEGAEEIVRDLIKITPHPCLLDIQNDSQRSALHLAVLCSNVRLVRMLLLAGAESSIRDKYGNTPLHLACVAGDLDCVRALTERITATEEATAVSCTGVLISNKSSSKGDAEVTKLDRPHAVQYADVELRNYDGERCVHIAAAVTATAQNKHVDVMRELVVRSGADVNAREGKAGYTPLHMAVERGDKDLVKFLLEECSNLNLEVASYGRWTAFQIATVNRNEDLVAMLRGKGAEPLDVSSSEESDDSDFDDNEIDIESHSAGSGYNSRNWDRMVPCVGGC